VSDRSAAGPAQGLTPFIEIGRAEWAALAAGTPQPLTDVELVRLRGLGEPLDSREVAEVYLPLSRLLNLYATGARQLHDRTRGFLRSSTDTTPFVIGVAGSVAVGKSTVARLLRENVLPTRSRARLVLRKAQDHAVHSVLLRKI
jgi:type I pantothenate kinase